MTRPDEFGSTQLLLFVLVTGIAATALLDLYALAAQAVFGARLPNYDLVGRWICHMPAGQFRHAAIASAPPCASERFIGWSAHYAIGVGFSAFLALLAGRAWCSSPRLGPALGVGLLTVLAPFLIMHPAFGLGVAGALAPDPMTVRIRSLSTHIAFGFCLFIASVAASRVVTFDWRRKPRNFGESE